MMMFFIMNYLRRMRWDKLFSNNYCKPKEETQIKNENCVDKATNENSISKESHQIEKNNDESFAGYVSRIQMPNGKIYKLKCEVTEVYDMTCRKCGSPLQLKYGSGTCSYCGTNYTTQFKIVEK